MRPGRARPEEVVAMLYDSWATADLPEALRRAAAAGTGRPTDDVLSDIIAADGRWRIGRGQAVTLQHYLDAVPDLMSRRLPLDAALEVSLKDLRLRGVAPAQAAARLSEKYPELAPEITTAAMLDAVVLSTATVRKRLDARSDDAGRSLPFWIGKSVDGRPRYELRECIGSGAQGSVYLGVDTLLSERDRLATVAVKLHHATAGREADGRRLLDEAAKARRVIHPSVVRVLDAGVTDDSEAYAVYEHVRGRTLKQVADALASPMPARRAAQIVLEAALGVQAIHAAGLTHCDLQPGNVMIDEQNCVKVADFGLALRQAPTASPREEDGHPRGALGFVSPEQWRAGPDAAAPAVDVYALGGLLVWLTSGRAPNGDTPEAATGALGRAGGEGSLRPVLTRDLDADLAAIAGRALAIDPERRYRSADAVASDLDAWLKREVIAWTQPSPRRRLRLFATRQPRLAAALVLAVLSLATVPAVIIAYSARLRDQRLQAQTAIAEEQRLAAEGKIKEASATVGAWIAALRRSRAEDFNSNFLPIVTVLDSVLGTLVLGTAPDGTDLWADRIRVAKAQADAAAAAGGPDSLESMNWEFLHGFWLAKAGDYQRADDSLALNLPRWERSLASDDPWLERVRGVRHAARVLNLRAAGLAEESDALRESREVIRVSLARLGDNPKDPCITLMKAASRGGSSDDNAQRP